MSGQQARVDRARFERAQAAFYPFLDPFKLSLNPDDIDEIIYAILVHVDGDADLEAIDQAVREQIAEYLDQHHRMYDALSRRRDDG